MKLLPRPRPTPGGRASALVAVFLLPAALACDSRSPAPVAPPAAAASIAGHELLEALGFDGRVEEIPTRIPGAALVEPDAAATRFARAHGVFVQAITIPPGAGSGPPRNGVDVLRSELADVDRFDLLYSPDGMLDAIVPSGPGHGTDAWFMDLTPYAIDLARLPGATVDELKRQAQSVLDRRGIVTAYIQDRGLSQRLRPVDALSKKPYVLVTLERETGEVGLEEFGPAELLDPASGGALADRLGDDGHHLRLVYPIFPTVYSPAVSNNQAQARNFGHHVHATLKRLAPRDGDRVLDVGTGSGYLSWVAWATGRALGRSLTMYALDINPLAAANARAMARLAGFPITAIAHDNVADAAGPAFPGTTFRLIIWDMPALPRLLKPYLSGGGAAAPPRQLMEYWDDGSAAYGSLRTFAETLPGLLEPAPAAEPSAAVLWNTAPADFPEAIPRTFENAGLLPRLLDTYTSGAGAITCVVYAVSLPKTPHPRKS